MKRLLGSLLILSSLQFANAASTDTIPAELKVVEIHMTRAEQAPAEQQKKKAKKSPTVIPLPGHGTCSGSFVDEFGDIITARHCVEGFQSFEVVTADRRTYAAEVIAVSKNHDLALIHIDRFGTPYFRLAPSVTRGEPVFVLGSPLGITDTLSTGIVARLDGDILLLDCGVLPGNSGGPVFNKDGELMGVASAGFIVFFGMTHLNIAQGLDAIQFFLYEVFVAKRK